jgi:hypothetical protein
VFFQRWLDTAVSTASKLNQSKYVYFSASSQLAAINYISFVQHVWLRRIWPGLINQFCDLRHVGAYFTDIRYSKITKQFSGLRLLAAMG